MLASVIDSAHERAHLLSVLGQADKPVGTQDQVLVWLFVLAVAAFFFTRMPQDLSVNDAYTLTHPPQAARMNLVMKAVQAWCAQNRPQLVDWLSRQRFQDLMRAVAACDSWDERRSRLGRTGSIAPIPRRGRVPPEAG